MFYNYSHLNRIH